MGAWGLKTFENDDAGDWVFDLIETNDLSLVESTLLGWNAEYLEAPDASCILAASEIVKALYKGIDKSLPDDIKQWVSNHQSLDASHLVPQAAQAIERVLSSDSELRELWEGSDEFEEWKAGIENLKKALSSQ